MAAVGSTAVQVAAVLELAHAGPEGAHSPSLPGDLEVRRLPGHCWWCLARLHSPRCPAVIPLHDHCRAACLPYLQGKLAETAEALSAVFHVLAARILATLEGCCLQRHRWENRLPCIPAGRRGPKADGPAAAPIDAGATAAPLLEAAAAAFQRLERGREAQRGSLAPSDVDLCVVASGACLVLLQQARAVAAVLDAAGQLGADSGEEIRLSIPPPATKFDGD